MGDADLPETVRVTNKAYIIALNLLIQSWDPR